MISRIKTKRMAVKCTKASNDALSYEWTYMLEDGVCTDSLALLTAAKFGLPKNVIDRAAEMRNQFDHNANLIPYNNFISDAEKSLSTASIVLKQITGSEKVDIIPPGWSPSPRLEGQSCVYILNVEDRFYVGETDSFSKRIQQHRVKGSAWKNLKVAVVAIKGGKSVARNFESLLIQNLAQKGFDLISVHDGRSISPLGQRN